MPSSACDWSSDVCSSDRSEEHTSELQSRSDLVCRLLLEKKRPQSRISNSNADRAAASPCNQQRNTDICANGWLWLRLLGDKLRRQFRTTVRPTIRIEEDD